MRASGPQLFAVAASFMGALALAAQEDAGSPWIETRFQRVHLRNGNTIDGRLVRDTQASVVLKLKVGEMEIRRDMIDRVELVRMRSLKEAPEIIPPKVNPLVKHDAEKSRPPQSASVSATELAPGVPKDVRDGLDAIIHAWLASPQGDLSHKLEPLSDEGVRYLCALLEETPRRVPAAPLCAALGKRRDPVALGSLSRILDARPHAPMKDREAAVEAIGQIGTIDAIPPLIRALEDPTGSVWRIASESLAAIAPQFPQARTVETVVMGLDRATEKGPYALTLGALGGDDAYRALLSLVRDSSDEHRLAALQGLLKVIKTEDGREVMPCLSSPNQAVRKAACAVLGRAKYKPAVYDLIQLLADIEGGGAFLDAHRALIAITGQTLARDGDTWRSWWEVAGKTQFPKD